MALSGSFLIEKPKEPLSIYWPWDPSVEVHPSRLVSEEDPEKAESEARTSYLVGDLEALQVKAGETATVFRMMPLGIDEWNHIHRLSVCSDCKEEKYSEDEVAKRAFFTACGDINNWLIDGMYTTLAKESWSRVVPPVIIKTLGRLILSLSRGGPNAPLF